MSLKIYFNQNKNQKSSSNSSQKIANSLKSPLLEDKQTVNYLKTKTADDNIYLQEQDFDEFEQFKKQYYTSKSQSQQFYSSSGEFKKKDFDLSQNQIYEEEYNAQHQSINSFSEEESKESQGDDESEDSNMSGDTDKSTHKQIQWVDNKKIFTQSCNNTNFQNNFNKSNDSNYNNNRQINTNAKSNTPKQIGIQNIYQNYNNNNNKKQQKISPFLKSINLNFNSGKKNSQQNFNLLQVPQLPQSKSSTSNSNLKIQQQSSGVFEQTGSSNGKNQNFSEQDQQNGQFFAEIESKNELGNSVFLVKDDQIQRNKIEDQNDSFQNSQNDYKYFEDQNQIIIDPNHSQIGYSSDDSFQKKYQFNGKQSQIFKEYDPLYTDGKKKKKYSFVIHKKSCLKNTMIKEFEQEDVGYQPAQIPSNVNIALSHKKANRLGVPINYQKVCMCCFKPVFKKRIQFWSAGQGLAKYGAGLPVYFKFIIHNIMICIGVFLINSVYTLIKEDELCKKYPNDCSVYIFNLKVIIPSSENKNEDFQKFVNMQTWLNLIFIVFFIVYTSLMQKHLQQNFNYYHKKEKHISQYTVQANGIPDKIKSKQLKHLFQDEIRSKFENDKNNSSFNKNQSKSKKNDNNNQVLHIGNQKNHIPKVKHAIRIFQVGEYYNLIQVQKELETELSLLQYQMRKTNDGKKKQKIKEKYQQTDKNIYRIKKFLTFTLENATFTGSAFISFKHTEMAQRIIEKYQISKFQRLKIFLRLQKLPEQLKIEGNEIEIKKAPEANDIIWENFGIPEGKLFWSRVLEFFLHLIFLVISTGTFLGMYELQIWLKKKYPELNNSYSIYELMMNFMISGVLMILIFGGKAVIRLLTNLRYYQTYSLRDSAILTKFLFFNMTASIIIPFIFSNYIIQGKEFGMWLPNLFFFVMFSSFSHIGYRLGNPVTLFHMFHLYLIKKYRIGIKEIHQQKLNNMFQSPEVFLPDLYSNVNKITMFAMVYSQTIPFIPLICALANTFTYFFDKMYMIRIWSEPTFQSQALFKQNNHNQGWILLCYTVLVCYNFINQLFKNTLKLYNEQYIIGIVVTFGITFVYFSLSQFIDVNEFLFKTPQQQFKKTKYNDMMFENTYDRCKPVRKNQENQRHIKRKAKLEIDQVFEGKKLIY